MAVIRYEVVKINNEFDGETCEFEAKVISIHKGFKKLFGDFTNFSAKKEMKVGEEFQDFNKMIYKKL